MESVNTVPLFGFFCRGMAVLAVASLTAGCATQRAGSGASALPSPSATYEMDPVKIQATRGPAGTQIEAFDAEELFEQAGKALSSNKYDDAVALYDKLLKNFPASPYARPALYNQGLALRDKKDWALAVAAFKSLVDRYPDHPDAKDALFQLGACFAEETNWPASAETFARILARNDLTADDRVEAMARRGFAQFNLGDMDTAENTFHSVLAYRKQIETEERLATDFYLAFSEYHLGQVTHSRFRSAPLRWPERQMSKDMEDKARLLLQAQRFYIETIKFGHPGWASAAGFQVGSLYEEFYDAFLNIPLPPEHTGEVAEVYQDELRKKIRILLEKSLRWQRENLLMIERLGVSTEWADKSKLAYAKLVKLLDEGHSLGTAPAGSGLLVPADGKGPPTPSVPTRPEPADRKPVEGSPQRQIL